MVVTVPALPTQCNELGPELQSEEEKYHTSVEWAYTRYNYHVDS